MVSRRDYQRVIDKIIDHKPLNPDERDKWLVDNYGKGDLLLDAAIDEATTFITSTAAKTQHLQKLALLAPSVNVWRGMNVSHTFATDLKEGARPYVEPGSTATTRENIAREFVNGSFSEVRQGLVDPYGMVALLLNLDGPALPITRLDRNTIMKAHANRPITIGGKHFPNETEALFYADEHFLHGNYSVKMQGCEEVEVRPSFFGLFDGDKLVLPAYHLTGSWVDGKVKLTRNKAKALGLGE